MSNYSASAAETIAPSHACAEWAAAAAAAPRLAPPHPLIAKYALKHPATAGSSSSTDRLSPLLAKDDTRLWHLTHIAKTGGRSLRKELLKLSRVVAGAEQCYAPFSHPSRLSITLFREPRSHVLSMYLHGAYAGKSRAKRRRAAGFPVAAAGADAAALAAAFRAWTLHFSRGWSPDKGDFYAYNPWNMQARSMTCADPAWNADFVNECERACSHHVGRNASDATPPLAPAINAVHSVGVVGVLSLLKETLCIVEYRIKRALPPHCICGANGTAAAAGGGIAHVVNPGQKRQAKLSLSDVPAETLAEVDRVTEVDRQLYRAAVQRLMCDIAQLERETGQTILCPERLDMLRKKTGHVAGLWP